MTKSSGLLIKTVAFNGESIKVQPIGFELFAVNTASYEHVIVGISSISVVSGIKFTDIVLFILLPY